MTACCADPRTEPHLREVASAVGSPTVVRMEDRVFAPIPLDIDTDAAELRNRLAEVVAGLEHPPH